jgi:hypothetical protein
VLALIPASLLVVGDAALADGQGQPPATTAATADASTAEAFLGWWPQPATLWSSIEVNPVTGRLASAEQWAQSAVDRDRTNATLLTSLAALQLANGQQRQGEQSARAAVRAQPCYVPALDLLGAIELSNGQRAEGLQLLRQSLALSPSALVEAYVDGQCSPVLPGAQINHQVSLGCGRP